MIRAVQIIITKTITFICKLFHKNGSVLPGAWAYILNPHVLDTIKYPKYVIGVTGSSGKGTTTNLIYHILKESGVDVVYNSSGSNIINGIITLILNNCNLKGEFKHDVLLLELDEKHLHLAFRESKLTHLVITNITRDQPARNGSPDLIYNEIMKTLNGKITLIINANDPGLLKATLTYPGKVITYGINKTKDSYQKLTNYNIDYAYCPKCHHKLIYDFYHYGHLGNYHCPNCDFNNLNLDYTADKVDLKKQEMTINNQLVHLNKDILYTAFATLSAYSVSKEIGLSEKQILSALNVHPNDSKRAHEYVLDNRKITMLESKNENSLSYFQSLQYIKNASGKKCVLLGFENVSRRYSYNDLSWLYDVDFELLNDPNITNIVLVGRFKYDVATRLTYANVDEKKFIFVDDLKDMVKILKEQTTGDIYTMVCFDMTEILLKELKEEA